jgi:hypothetical protein
MVKSQDETSKIEQSYTAPIPRASAAIPSTSTIEPESTSGWVIALLVVMLFGVCALGAIGVWYYFLR